MRAKKWTNKNKKEQQMKLKWNFFLILFDYSVFVCILCARNLSHTMTEFNLFTAYNAPGQENITDEDAKEKIIVLPIVESIDKCTKEQLEDIVKGWIRHIKKLLKSYEQKVRIQMPRT